MKTSPYKTLKPASPATDTFASRWDPTQILLAAICGMLFVWLFSAFLNPESTVQLGEFLKGQVGFECLTFGWFWLLAVGFAIGAGGGWLLYEMLELSSSQRAKMRPYAMGAALFLISTVIYIPAMTAQWIWDDDQEVHANSALLPIYNPKATTPAERFSTNWKGLWDIWTGGITSYRDDEDYRKSLGKDPAPWLIRAARVPFRAVEWQIWGNNDPDHIFRCNQFADYLPLKTSVLWLEFQLWGYRYQKDTQGNPVRYIIHPEPFHIMNILQHALCAVLLWLVLLRMNVPGAWLGALIFAIHPVHAESVAWLTERKNTLSLTFVLISMLWWIRFEASENWRYWTWALLFYIAGVLSKMHVVLFPAVLVLYTWWNTGRVPMLEPLWKLCRPYLKDIWPGIKSDKEFDAGELVQDLKKYLPFFIIAALISWATVWFQHDRAIGGEVIPIGDFDSRLAGASVVTWAYLSKVLFPINLTTIYGNTSWLWWPLTSKHIGGVDPKPWMYFVGLMIPVSLVLTYIIPRKLFPNAAPRALRTPFFVWAFFLGVLMPVMGFFTMSYMRLTLQADHFQYYSDIAICAAIGAGIALLYRKFGKDGRIALSIAVGIVIAIFCLYTWHRAGVHQSEETLWEDALKYNEASWQAHNHIGAVYYGKGIDFMRAGNVAKAQEWIQKSSPHFWRAVELKPENPEVHNNKGLVIWNEATQLQKVGRMEEAMAKFDHAIAEYREAVRIKGDVVALRRNLADALTQLGRFGDAVVQYDVMIKDFPGESALHSRRGALLFRMGRFSEAKEECEEALRIDPNNGEARQVLEAIQKAGQQEK